LWQTTFFYVRNAGDEDLINLPAFNPAPPAKTNWQYNPGRDHAETNRVVRFMQRLMKDTDICSDDIIRTFISRRVLPLQQRAHKISEMYGPGDPTKITGLALSKEDVVLKASQICQTDMPDDWEWGLCPLSARNPPSEDVRRYAALVVLAVAFVLVSNPSFPFVFRPRPASPGSIQTGEALARRGPWTSTIRILSFIGWI
jgi:hypothetical protein